MLARTTDFCANCPVDTGECPRCGTFWFRQVGGDNAGKRYGIRRVTEQAFHGPTSQLFALDQLGNVVTRFDGYQDQHSEGQE